MFCLLDGCLFARVGCLIALRARCELSDWAYPHPQKRLASTAPYPFANSVRNSSTPSQICYGFLAPIPKRLLEILRVGIPRPPRKFILNFLYPKSRSGKYIALGNSSTQDVACGATLLLLSSLLQLNVGGMSCMQFSETIPAKVRKRSLTLSRKTRRKWKVSSGRLRVS